MKHLLLAGTLCVCRPWVGHAQGVATWIEQLAALRTLEETVQQGYTTVKNGLTHIGDIRYDEYELHSRYYGSLTTVNPVIQSDPKIVELRTSLTRLVQGLQKELAFWQTQHPIDQP